MFERAPVLEEPNWALAQEKLEPNQSRSQLEKRVEELTLNLKRSEQQVVMQDSIIEGSQAQLALQAVYVHRLNEALHLKETRKDVDRTKLFPNGNPRLITGDGFTGEQEAAELARQEKLEAKAQRRLTRDQKKAKMVRGEEAWKNYQAVYAKEVQEWKDLCDELTSGGTKKKNLPKRPKCMLKALVLAAAESESESCTDDNDGNGDDDEGDE